MIPRLQPVLRRRSAPETKRPMRPSDKLGELLRRRAPGPMPLKPRGEMLRQLLGTSSLYEQAAWRERALLTKRELQGLHIRECEGLQGSCFFSCMAVACEAFLTSGVEGVTSGTPRRRGCRVYSDPQTLRAACADLVTRENATEWWRKEADAEDYYRSRDGRASSLFALPRTPAARPLLGGDLVGRRQARPKSERRSISPPTKKGKAKSALRKRTLQPSKSDAEIPIPEAENDKQERLSEIIRSLDYRGNTLLLQYIVDSTWWTKCFPLAVLIFTDRGNLFPFVFADHDIRNRIINQTRNYWYVCLYHSRTVHDGRISYHWQLLESKGSVLFAPEHPALLRMMRVDIHEPAAVAAAAGKPSRS